MNLDAIFPITVGVLVFVEILLIIKIIALTKALKELQTNMTQKFDLLVEQISDKFRRLIDLAVEFQTTKERQHYWKEEKEVKKE